jgi:hypothetical protein
LADYFDHGSGGFVTGGKMEPRDYIVLKIDGDYAYLAEVGQTTSDNPVARAFLPEEIEEGCKLHWEDFVYTMAE